MHRWKRQGKNRCLKMFQFAQQAEMHRWKLQGENRGLKMSQHGAWGASLKPWHQAEKQLVDARADFGRGEAQTKLGCTFV
jgi:hypothetical protein